MKNFFARARGHIFRGLLAVIPLGLSYLVLQFIYSLIDRPIAEMFYRFTGLRIPGLGILVLLLLLYCIGIMVSNMIGRGVFNLIEGIFNRIPILKTTYQIGKQLSSTFSLSEKQVFKKAVLLDHFREGVWTIGFVTGSLKVAKTGETLLKVFVPTVPNPTTGFIAIVKESQVVDPGWTVEEAMRAIISGGIIGPETIQNFKN